MKNAPRFHVPASLSAEAVGSEWALPDPATHHALRVLRLAVGDAVTLFNGAGGEFAATLTRADKRSAWVRLEAFDPVEREAALAITLVQGIAANDAMDFIVRKSVELGVTAIQPVLTSRSARFPTDARGDKRLAHWRQIAIAACEQCGRNRVPAVHDVTELETWIASHSATASAIVLSPESTRTWAQLTTPTAGIDLLIGPEGGWTEQELARAARAGCAAVRLGPRVLRAETAAVAALAAINTLWGDFR